MSSVVGRMRGIPASADAQNAEAAELRNGVETGLLQVIDFGAVVCFMARLTDSIPRM